MDNVLTVMLLFQKMQIFLLLQLNVNHGNSFIKKRVTKLSKSIVGFCHYCYCNIWKKGITFTHEKENSGGYFRTERYICDKCFNNRIFWIIFLIINLRGLI